MTPRYEKSKLKQGFRYVIGCDEVGRGCLAGPVVAAAVILDLKYKIGDLKEVNDSKLLKPETREKLDKAIRANAISVGLGIVERDIIDKINIHNASLLAMKKAIESLPCANSHELAYEGIFAAIDGKFKVPSLDIEQEAIIDGDARVLSIAAASIVAKVYRDNLMKQLDKQFPQYFFAEHKGYATLKHRTAIKKFGLTSLHRLTFCGQYL